ncbi:hypothetical protein BU24DRAFT_376282 [Aaosphaeria arxii CBS 175.79]|uniref:Nucleolar 27S pre-rRNA processing Urb2/Npa2 C-terminal domain-containing protein n=1 Tax=Aaosphaeria arxii CBS 175.79 TaxID=1450172 RepID=A0A6A5XEL1_9PLEO|nr:uncharacterized protein BU24DRAFT_376282 [Aaosphaeria arxii CBS 175.79]KAF2011237.1 hypothetical protein BU24DRAFT_376282 [Aaosphaeria arxii CBS 175.79]
MPATATMVSKTAPVATLPRLLAINKDFSDLNEQISQVTHIIGLPAQWCHSFEEQDRSTVVQQLPKARAEWVLRWTIEKLKDDSENGTAARANSKLWALLDLMVYILPVPRSATHLRDAAFLGILEKTLQESFESSAAIQPSSNGAEPRSSDSSETVREELPSRKRKRPSTETAPTSSKKRALDIGGLVKLFDAVARTLQTITSKASALSSSEDAPNAEHMKMALRTESAQAARVLKYWLTAVERFLQISMSPSSTLSEKCLDLSSILEVWNLRYFESGDEQGASAEQFSTECLIPTLALHNTTQKALAQAAQQDKSLFTESLQSVEILIVKHIFVPSRAAFFSGPAPIGTTTTTDIDHDSSALAANLEPLRAKLLQAAQILDTSISLPDYFKPLFDSVPQLLDIAIRYNPSRTPRARINEQPWLQAVFIALAECIGCPLEAASFSIPQPSIDALEKSLGVLQARDVRIDPEVLVKMFWFHTGVKYPESQPRTIQWSLIAALIKLDATAFIMKSASKAVPSENETDDLVAFLFQQISDFQAASTSLPTVDKMDIDGVEESDDAQAFSESQYQTIIRSILIPIFTAFARNRDLLGFLRRWDAQLVLHAPIVRKPLQELTRLIWEDFSLNVALADKLEQSLTQAQIVTLFQEHAERIKPLKISEETSTQELKKKHILSLKEAYSSATLIRAILGSIDNDLLLEALQPALLDVLLSLSSTVQSSWYRSNIDLYPCWITIAQVTNNLWPLTLHGSPDKQKELLEPLISRATKDVSHARKNKHEHGFNSRCRSAVLLFLLASSDLLRTVPGWSNQLHESLRKGLKVLTPGHLEPDDLQQLLVMFCTEYVQLLDHNDSKRREKTLFELLNGISTLDSESGIILAEQLAELIFTTSTVPTRVSFASALLRALDQQEEGHQLYSLAVPALLQIRPESLPRDRREELLNKITDILLERPRNAASLLRIMVYLMETSNATANISSDSSVLFDIAERLTKGKIEDTVVMRLLQELVSSTLGHILQNKDQAQNERFLQKYKKKLSKSSKSLKTHSPARLALLSGTLLAPKQEDISSWESFLDILDEGLNDVYSAEDRILGAYIDLPSQVLNDDTGLFNKARSSLKGWLDQKLQSNGSASTWSSDLLASLETGESKTRFIQVIGKYHLCPVESIEDFIKASSAVLSSTSTAAARGAIARSIHDVVSSIPLFGRVALAVDLSNVESSDQAHSYVSLPIILSTFDDKTSDDEEIRTQQLSILPTICTRLEQVSDSEAFNSLMDAINVTIRDKPHCTNQHGIECVLAAIASIVSRASPSLPVSDASAIYGRICETSRLILLLHRGRLGGRFHILLPPLQNLLFCLFIPHAGRGSSLPFWLRSSSASSQIKLSPANATQFSRLLSTLSSPTQSSVSTTKHQRNASTKSTLNDPVKAAKEYASHFIYPLLASFCRFSLSGRLEPNVRDKLIPGLWDTISVADMDRDTLQAMFTGLDRASKDVWRGVWDEWKKMNGKSERDNRASRGE